ncbi:hypothetical protein Tcan_16868 [Toxocara canis]|uniref:Uncharacterized protein n=1 Tax=Toxocara canis TaxID=6265 RepID=A0A0B2V2B9_TOXCA|nr:hypothetical protein Tcan_16868 [Toxocara canis]
MTILKAARKGDVGKGWQLVQKNLSAIIEYGRAEGILPSLEEKKMCTADTTGMLMNTLETGWMGP